MQTLKNYSTQLILLAMISFLIFSCAGPDSVDKFVGTWKEGDETRYYIERWQKDSDDSYSGDSYQIFRNDSIWSEEFKLYKIGEEEWVFEVFSPQQHEKPVIFKVTSFTSNGFTATNPDNEFPKLISYEVSGDRLDAFISNGEGTKKTPFNYKRLK